MKATTIEGFSKNPELALLDASLSGDPLLVVGAKAGPYVLVTLDEYNRLKGEAYSRSNAGEAGSGKGGVEEGRDR
ncbi:MAG: hypothetical protein PUG38_10490 [Sutterellaceae bacterium]|nr:hypothetical protein [Sutterellaceae bacterium]MDY2867671.1 hypothetical protein [Mesosutterella sp.]